MISLHELDQWGEFLRAGNAARDTIRLRTHYVRRCLNEIGKSPGEVTELDLTGWLGGKPGWSPSARKSARASLRSFWSWRARTLGGDNPAEHLPGTPVPRALPRPAEDAAVLDALRTADDRVALMVELMAYAGLRRGEVSRVHSDDLQGDTLRIVGKGGHVRMVPLPPHVGKALRDRGPGWVFTGQIDGHLSAGRVGELVAEALPGRLTGHQLRHRFATVSYRGSHDIRAVQQLLGHARIDTTMIYTAVDQDATRAAASAAWSLTG